MLIGCKSKEKKAAEIIKTELSKTLYDFDSYEPIETIVSEANQSAYNDTTCWRKANALLAILEKSVDFMAEANVAKEHMDIWGPPTYYSSTYSDNKYHKYRQEFIEKFKMAIDLYNVFKSKTAELRDSINALDPNKVIGWEIKHSFRCKTRGGLSSIENYRYVVDKDFKNVLIQEDMDSKDHDLIKKLIDGSLNDIYPSINLP